MPKTKHRRRGVTRPHKHGPSGKRFSGWNLDRPKVYYDPGVKPKTPNFAKQAARAQRPRRNARGK